MKPRRKSPSTTTIIALSVGAFALCLLVIVPLASDPPKKEKPPADKPAAAQQYKILEDIKQPPGRRMVTAMLPERITESQVAAISKKIRFDAGANEFNYISIRFHIPEMPVKKGIWAKSTLKKTGEDEIKIHGLTIDCLKRLLEAPRPTADQIIGGWIDETPGSSKRKVIYRIKDEYYMEFLMCGSDIIGTTQPLNVAKNQTQFALKDDTDGEYYRINQAGDLELCDADGCTVAGKKTGSYQR